MAYFLTAFIIAVSFLGQSLFGFGGGLLAIPLLSHVMGVREGVTVALAFQLLMGLLVCRTHGDVSWNKARPLLVGLVPGTVLGTYCLSMVDESRLRVFLGVFVLLFAAKSLFRPQVSRRGMSSAWWATGIGALAGWVQGMIGTGGPLFVMYLQESLPRKTTLRATLILTLFASNVIRVLVSLPVGLLGAEVGGKIVAAIPFFLAAIVAGQRLHVRVTERQYRYGLNLILFSAGLSLLLR